MADPQLIQIASERITLRPPQVGDAMGIQRYYDTNREHLRLWQPVRPEGFFDLNAIKARIFHIERERVAGRVLHLLVLENSSGEVIGECNFSNIVLGVFQACHLGYSIAVRAQGHGLMSEALRLGIGYVFDELSLHRIMANYLPENQRSARVLSGLGFEREGLARAYLKINGVWADHVLTSLINPAQP